MLLKHHFAFLGFGNIDDTDAAVIDIDGLMTALVLAVRSVNNDFGNKFVDEFRGEFLDLRNLFDFGNEPFKLVRFLLRFTKRYAKCLREQCEILGIADFEKESRSLCMKVFGSIDLPVLCESECEMLEYYMFSTTYGTQKQGIQHRLEKKYGSTGTTAKFRYLFRRVFPKIEFYKKFCPFAYRHRILIPFVWIYRFVRVLFVRRKHIKHEINAVNKIK